MHENAPRGGAALAGGTHGAEHDRRNGEIQIGLLIDDDRVVAAEFEQALAETLRHARPDLAAHGRGAGEGQEGDARVIGQSNGELMARIDEDLKDRGERMPLEHAVAQPLHGERAQSGLR